MHIPSAPGALPRGPLAARPRLTERLAERFHARLTVVVGAAGSGKTTLLAQAMAASDHDLDVWCPCTHLDRSPQRLGARVAEACARAVGQSIPSGSADPVDAIRELCLGASPRQVCIVLDDVHVLGDGEVIAALLAALPRNGHLLVSGRSIPSINQARLDTIGELVEIDQDDLMMTETELVNFANRRGVDVGELGDTGGWPAFVELAATGLAGRPREYLEQESLAGLDAERRRALAAFAFVGGGDDEMSLAVTGVALTPLVEGLPLVRWSGTEAQLHDLWIDLLVDQLDADGRAAAADVASQLLIARRSFDRAVLLQASIENWNGVIHALAAAIRDGVDSGLRVAQLERWRTMLPREVAASPTGLLVSGVIERERDPTSALTEELFREAADGFASAGDHEFELVALLQLGYVARVSGAAQRLVPVIERIGRLAEQYPPAAPYLAFGAAWTALTRGKPDEQLAAMESIVETELPPVWAQSRNHLLAHALYNLGRPEDGLRWAPTPDDSLPIPVPGALITRSQCLWHSGRPEDALAARVPGLDHRHGARDRFIASAWVALMEAFAGHLDAARSALGVATSHAGAVPAEIVTVQLVGIELLIGLVAGDEDRTARELAAILDTVPLGGGVTEQTLRTLVALPYVLVPASRSYWVDAELGPAIRRGLEIAQAFVEARAGELDRLRSIDYPEPGVAAANLPVTWAVEFALYSIEAGRSEGRRLVAWLCEQWGDPARSALIAWGSDDRLGSVARALAASTPMPPNERVSIQVLGATTVTLAGYGTTDPNWRRERVRALIAWLVVHRAGTRDRIAGELWPDLPADRAAKNLRTTLNYLHQVLEPRRRAGDATWFVQVDGSQVRINDRTDVDCWRFAALVDQADDEQRVGRPTAALPLLLEACGVYGGDLAADLDHQWLDLERIHVRSRFVRAACRAADLLVATGRPGEAIEPLRRAVQVDPWNERTYIALSEAYEALGDRSAADQVLALAAAQLGALEPDPPRRRR